MAVPVDGLRLPVYKSLLVLSFLIDFENYCVHIDCINGLKGIILSDSFEFLQTGEVLRFFESKIETKHGELTNHAEN